MARRRYSAKEALNRFLRYWQGTTIPTDEPGTLDGEILSENEAWSDIAELFGDSLPNQTITIPDSVRATTAEAQAGTNDTKAVTPAGVAAAIAALAGANIEYGEIYNNSTGTAVVALSTSWAKVTGSFQGETVSSDNIVPDYANDKITVNHVGLLFVGLQVSFSGTANATVEGCLYLDGVRQESVRFRRKLGATGDVGSASAIGIVQATGTSMDLELYARADSGTPNFNLQSGQVWIYSLPLT